MSPDDERFLHDQQMEAFTFDKDAMSWDMDVKRNWLWYRTGQKNWEPKWIRSFDRKETIASPSLIDFLVKHDLDTYGRRLPHDIGMMPMTTMDKVHDFEKIMPEKYIYPDYFQRKVLFTTWVGSGRTLEHLSPVLEVMSGMFNSTFLKHAMDMDNINGTMMAVKRIDFDKEKALKKFSMLRDLIDPTIDLASKIPRDPDKTKFIKNFVTTAREDWGKGEPPSLRKKRALKFLNSPDPEIQRHAVRELMRCATTGDDVKLYWFKSSNDVKSEFMRVMMEGNEVSCDAMKILRDDIKGKKGLDVETQHFRGYLNRKYLRVCGDR